MLLTRAKLDDLDRKLDRRFASNKDSTGTFRVWQNGQPINTRLAFISTFWKSGIPFLTPFTLATALYQVGFSVVLVVTADAEINVASAVKRLSAAGLDVSPFVLATRNNIGKDFGGFKDAFHHFRNEIDRAEAVFIGNDSLVGPLFTSHYFDMLRNASDGLWGPTESFDRSYHLQSSHLLFCGRSVIKRAQSFFDSYRFYVNRTNIVKHGEVALTTCICNARHPVTPFYPTGILAQRKRTIRGQEASRNVVLDVNPQHFYFDSLLYEGFPFVKKELLVANPMGIPQVASRVVAYLDQHGQSPEVLFRHFRPV